MAGYVHTPTRTFQAGAAIAQHLRVKMSSGKLAASGAADDDVGTMEDASFADLDCVAVRLPTAEGTCKMVAAAAITLHAKVYQAAAGKVDDAVTGKLVGIALTAATADLDVIEVLRLGAGGTDSPLAGVAAGYKVARGQHTTLDADDTVITGLATVVSVVASLDSDPVAGCQDVTASIGNQAGAPAAGSVFIKTWKATAAGDTAVIPATTFTKLVNWIAVGT